MQPSGCHTTADTTTGRTLNESFLKHCKKGGKGNYIEICTQIHQPGSFLCPWSHLPPDAEYLATIPFFKKHPGGLISFYDPSRFPSRLVLQGFPARDRPLGCREGVIIVVWIPPADMLVGWSNTLLETAFNVLHRVFFSQILLFLPVLLFCLVVP